MQTDALIDAHTEAIVAQITGATTTTTSLAAIAPANTITRVITVVVISGTAMAQATDMDTIVRSTVFSITTQALTLSGGFMSAMGGTIIRSTISAIAMWCRSGFTDTDAVIGKSHCFAMTHMATATSSGAAAASITAING